MDKNQIASQILNGILNEYKAKQQILEAEIQNLLHNFVAVADHENLALSIKNKIEELDKYTSLVSTMQITFSSNTPKE